MDWRARLSAFVRADPVQVPREALSSQESALKGAAAVMVGLAEALEAVRRSKAGNDWASRQAQQVRGTVDQLSRSSGLDLARCVHGDHTADQWRSRLMTAFHDRIPSGQSQGTGSACPLFRRPLECVEREGSRVDQGGMCPGCGALTADLLRKLSTGPDGTERRQGIHAPLSDHHSHSRSSSIALDVLIEFVQMAGSGVIGTYAFMAVNSRVADWLRRRKSYERPTSLQTLAAARAMINHVWRDELPGWQEPCRESYGIDAYEVTFRHGGAEFVVRGRYDPNVRPEVERRRVTG